MSKNNRLMALLLVLVLGFLYSFYEYDEKDRMVNKLLVSGLNGFHYSPTLINDSFSVRVYETYLKRLDYNKKFFIQKDIQKLEQFKFSIDDEMKNSRFDYFDLSSALIEKRMDVARKYCLAVLKKPFVYDVNEKLELDDEKLNFAKDESELKGRWRLAMKHQVLGRIYEVEKSQKKAIEKNDTTVTIKAFELIEEEARAMVLKRNVDWFDRLDQLEKADRMGMYFNAIATNYDPHTNYYPPRQKEDFDISMSGRLEGIGATLQQKDGYVKVVRIVQGSASWRQGDLKAGDFILKVAQGEEEAVDVVGMRLDKAVKLIRGKKGTEVRLTVKKIDNAIVEISIVRDIVVIEETYAKSALLRSSSDDKPIGYIKLPKFYIDLSGKGGRDCSEDVKKEIEELKAKDVGGVIIDLRNNGGGSLYDVVDIVGLFIEKGPVVQVKGRGGAPYVLRDKDPSVQYDGPLVVLVNSLSASASEIFAAAIQDYERGIIIGSPSTFGKGTVQRFTNLDEMIRIKDDNLSNLGAVKITIQKFYRVNGGATQLKGVTPDIVLYDSYSFLDIGERELENPMPWDKISAAHYYVSGQISGEKKKLNENSRRRVGKDSTLIYLEKNARRLREIRDNTLCELDYQKFSKEQNQIERESELYKNLSKDTTGVIVDIPVMDMAEIKNDTLKIERLRSWQDELKKDAYIKEAVNVINDMRDL